MVLDLYISVWSYRSLFWLKHTKLNHWCMTSMLIDKSTQLNHVHRIYIVPTSAMPVLLPIVIINVLTQRWTLNITKSPKRIWHNHKISLMIFKLSWFFVDCPRKGIIYNTIVTVVIWLRWQEFKCVKWGCLYFSTFIITIKILTYHKAHYIITFFFKMKTYEIPMIKLEVIKVEEKNNNGRIF